MSYFLDCVYLCKSLDWEFHGGYPWEDKVPNKALYEEGPSRGPNLYLFYIPVMTKKVPLSYTFHSKMVPL